MESKMQSVFRNRYVIAAATTAVLTGGLAYLERDHFAISQAKAVVSQSGAATESARALALPDFAGIVEQHGAAVVNVSVIGTMKAGAAAIPGMPQDPNDPFFEFFRRFQPSVPRGGIPTHGQGSGFIVSADGVVLTNAHVVADANEVTVKLTDKREFKAKVVGIDKITDVAVLRISAQNLPVVKIGDPQRTRVGEWVVAIGSPFGFENSVTAGIVSAKSRSLPDEGYVPFLQTDVAINPGNSGGPLFNLDGEVIGINSQIYSRSGGYQGLSFAIPIDVALKVEQQLLDHGKVSRGRIGVYIQEVNQELAESFGLRKPYGALVSSVEPGSPAEKAGIEPGDVILQFNGKDIVRSAELPPMVADLSPGSHVKLQIWRKGTMQELSMSLGEMKTAEVMTGSREDNTGKLGLLVRPLTPNERKSGEIVEGLLVEHVMDGPAARAGIQPGDVILSVNGEKAGSSEELRSLVDKKGQRVALHILRGDRKMFVPIKIG
jgi:serine protease Do